MTANKTIYTVAGLPRSGSTLLMNILGQNPRFHVTPTSGILDVMSQIRTSWDKNQSFRAIDSTISNNKKLSVLQAVFQAYFDDVEEPVCIDKNRGWPAHLEMLEAVLGNRDKVKVLLTVRDLRDVLASFELLHRKTSALGQTPHEYGDPKRSRTAAGRMEIWVDQEQPVGRAYNAIRDAFTRGWQDCIHIIEYEHLTSNPKETLSKVYDFLGEAQFNHDFQNVEQLTFEDDQMHGYKDLHKIRQTVTPQKPKWSGVFDQTVRHEKVWEEVESTSQFWRAYSSK